MYCVTYFVNINPFLGDYLKGAIKEKKYQNIFTLGKSKTRIIVFIWEGT